MSTSLRPPASTDAQRSASGRRRPGSRLERNRAAAGLAAVCVMALGLTACSLKDAKAEASVSASASASAAVARAEKGVADANASATASREAALTPELRAKRDAAWPNPHPPNLCTWMRSPHEVPRVASTTSSISTATPS